MKIFLYYILLINLYGLFIMYSDKKRAIKGKYRTPERRIFVIAILLGSLGVLLGMYLFRHKTKHKKFVFGIPSILLVQLFILFQFIKISNFWININFLVKFKG